MNQKPSFWNQLETKQIPKIKKTYMPTIHRDSGYSFRFYSNENNEPPHIHAIGKGGEMKVWLNKDLEVERVNDISSHEQTKILKIIKRNQEKFLYEWFEFKKRETN